MINFNARRLMLARPAIGTAIAGLGIAALFGLASPGAPAAAVTAPVQLTMPRTFASLSPVSEATTAPAVTDAHAHDNAFYGVSCLRWTDCMAVGSRAVGKAANLRPLAARWSGRRWKAIPMPGPASGARGLVTAVSCKSARRCVASGYHYSASGHGYAPLAEFWNGKSWRIIQEFRPASTTSAYLNDVSCLAVAGCLAVGGSAGANGGGRAIAERWTGRRWRFSKVPQPSGALATELEGIGCAGRDCVAVGAYEIASGRILALAERWNGKTWHLLPAVSAHTPLSVLYAVSCHTGTTCMAVGESETSTALRPLAELWRHGRWRQAYGGRVAYGTLSGVSCPDLKWCAAVGMAGRDQLAEVWSGKKWRVARTQLAPDNLVSELNQLSCGARTIRCVTVGARYRIGHSSDELTLGQWWDGRSWRFMPTPNP